MSRTLRLAALTVSLFIAAAFACIVLQNARAQSEVKALLAAAGFHAANLPEPEKHFGLLRYKNIRLDEDGFSTLALMEAAYRPLSGKIKTLDLSGLTVTGKTDEDGRLAIPGWRAPEDGFPPPETWPESLSVAEASIAVLTDLLGGISLDLALQGRRSGGGIDFTASISSRQKNLGFAMRGQGRMGVEGIEKAEFEIDRGRIAAGPVKAMRASGRAEIAASAADPLITATFRIGGLALYGFPWQDGILGIKGGPGRYRFDLKAKSVGYEGMILRLAATLKDKKWIAAGILKTPETETFLDYLRHNDALTLTDDEIKNLEELGEAKIQILLPNIKEEKLTYIIKNEKEHIVIEETFHLKSASQE